jgi:hypothetical protein
MTNTPIHISLEAVSCCVLTKQQLQIVLLITDSEVVNSRDQVSVATVNKSRTSHNVMLSWLAQILS